MGGLGSGSVSGGMPGFILAKDEVLEYEVQKMISESDNISFINCNEIRGSR